MILFFHPSSENIDYLLKLLEEKYSELVRKLDLNQFKALDFSNLFLV